MMHTPLTDEDGSSSIGSVFGVLMFLMFVMLAVQVTTHLATQSRVGAMAFDTASAVARGEKSCGQGVDELNASFSAWGGTSSCRPVGQDIVVRVTGDSPASAINAFGQVFSLDTIVREARVRIEEFQ